LTRICSSPLIFEKEVNVWLCFPFCIFLHL
jgi:hypothetical protein